MNISLAIKQSLRIENETQYTNYQINNSIKNQIYPKISHNTSLWTDCIYSGLNVTKIHIATIIRHEKQINCKTINNFRHSVSLHIIGE